MSKKRIHFVSLGCPKNRVDTEVMVGVALGASGGRSGWELTDEADEAEVIVVNTCGFIGEAKKESIDTIFEMAELKKVGACKKLVVTGCLSQRYPQELSAQMPEVDHFLGSSDMLALGRILDDKKNKTPRMLVGNPADWVIKASDPRVVTGSSASAYLKLAEGCNRSCAFCTIPQFRGKQRSRPADDIVREAEQLAARGILEVNLISQDTIAYGRDLPKDKRSSLAELVRRVADVKGIKWVRVFYLYPETIDEALLDLFASHPRVVPYVDMPLQHASDAMLARMSAATARIARSASSSGCARPSPTSSSAPRSSSGTRARATPTSPSCELRRVGRVRARRRVQVLRRGDRRSFEQDGKVQALVVANRWRKLMACSARSRERRTRRSSAASSTSSSKARARSTSSS